MNQLANRLANTGGDAIVWHSLGICQGLRTITENWPSYLSIHYGQEARKHKGSVIEKACLDAMEQGYLLTIFVW